MTCKILRKFQALDLDGKSLVNYQIKFIEPEFYEESLNIMEKFFIPDAAMNRARKIKDDKIGVKYLIEVWRNILEGQKISVGCFKVDGESEILVGVNILSVKKKDEKENEIEPISENLRDIFATLSFVESQFNVFEHYKVDAYLSAFGLSVNNLYRGRGIAVEILKAREEVLKRLGLKVTSTLFTGIGSQKAAKKADFEENFEILYNEIHKINEKLFFQGIENIFIKIMSLKID